MSWSVSPFPPLTLELQTSMKSTWVLEGATRDSTCQGVWLCWWSLSHWWHPTSAGLPALCPWRMHYTIDLGSSPASLRLLELSHCQCQSFGQTASPWCWKCFWTGLVCNCRVQALVMMSVFRSFMYALTGGSLRPGLMGCLPTIHWDALMITSTAMVKGYEEVVQPAMISTSRCCHTVV